MKGAGKAVRRGTIVWSVSLGVLVVVLGGSIILPSTKRAHIDFRNLHGGAPENGPATAPATAPATEP